MRTNINGVWKNDSDAGSSNSVPGTILSICVLYGGLYVPNDERWYIIENLNNMYSRIIINTVEPGCQYLLNDACVVIKIRA